MNHMRVRPLVAGLAALASLTLVAGCSGSDSDSDSGKGGKQHGSQQRQPEPTSTKAEAKAKGDATAVLGEARLKAALVTEAEAKDKGYTAVDNDAKAARPTAGRPECRALADATASGVERTPAAKAWTSRSYGSTTSAGLAVTTVLMSYEGVGAARTVADLRTAIGACGSGFKTRGNSDGSTLTYVSVRSGKAPEGGDEALAWTMTGEAQGQRVPLNWTAVREGDTVALFLTIHRTDPAGAKLPQDLLDAQLAKLSAAGK
ncbi:hypothetical protein [Streptomyces sp. NBC_01304]|uniref:hypothetical protein n=1 Tax=Streptomyces sp. NBC_01304 TaxID=2903818 RepID=UPI002E14C5CF|nr:hypothetical protein OG430_19905 [Streptomyces sp. NBC_01304]